MSAVTVENTPKLPGETFRAEPLYTENSWRVRRSSDGQSVLFRVSRDFAERFASEMNAKPTTSALSAPDEPEKPDAGKVRR